MMETQINKEQVIRLFENNGFDYNQETNEFVYEDEAGIKRAFPLPWLSNDDTKLYDLGSVRKLLTKMMETVKLSQNIIAAANDDAFMADVAAALREYGMSVLEQNNTEQNTEQSQVFVYHEPGVVAFTAPLDYIVSTVLYKRAELEKIARENRAEKKIDKLSTKDLVLMVLDIMKMDAMESKKEQVNNGQSNETTQESQTA